jgi:hypothetical protein
VARGAGKFTFINFKRSVCHFGEAKICTVKIFLRKFFFDTYIILLTLVCFVRANCDILLKGAKKRLVEVMQEII